MVDHDQVSYISKFKRLTFPFLGIQLQKLVDLQCFIHKNVVRQAVLAFACTLRDQRQLTLSNGHSVPMHVLKEVFRKSRIIH